MSRRSLEQIEALTLHVVLTAIGTVRRGYHTNLCDFRHEENDITLLQYGGDFFVLDDP